MFPRIAAALLGLALCVLTVDAGGGKKKDEPAGTIEIYKNKEGEYRFRIKNAEGKTIAIPLANLSWEKRADAVKAINELKTILNSATPTDVKDEAPEMKKVEKKPATTK